MRLVLAVMLSGCLSAHRVRIESNPPGALVSVKGQELGTTPLELTTFYFPLRWYNFNGRTTVQLEAPGYRPGRIRMGRGAGRRVFWDTVLVLLPDQFNGPLPWQWRWGHLTRLVGLSPRYTHQVELIRRHKRAGTWTPEDAERLQ